MSGTQADAHVFFVKLIADGKYDRYGFYVEPRLRDSKLRGWWAGPVWIEQAFLSADLGTSETPLTLKAGKIYSRLGLMWDNSFWGNLHALNGLKLAADVGLSAEGRFESEKGSGVNYLAQFFVVDGGINYALPNRDTLTLTGARRRNEVVGRIEPYLKLGEGAVLKPAVSAQFLRADIPGAADDVARVSGDLTLNVGPWGLWGEYTHQQGYTTNAYPIEPVVNAAGTTTTPGRGSADTHYVLAGTELTIGPVTGRFNTSYANYADRNINEWMVVPALAVKLNNYITILGEYDEWHKSSSATPADRSLTFTLHGTFSGKVVDRK